MNLKNASSFDLNIFHGSEINLYKDEKYFLNGVLK